MVTTTLMPLPKQQFLTNLGTPLFGGKIYTFAAGTTTPKPTYTDSDGTALQPNPIPLNLRGEPTSPIFWSGNYRVDVQDRLGNLIYSVDNYNTDPAGVWNSFAQTISQLAASAGASLLGYIAAGTGALATTVQDKLRERVSVFDFMTSAQRADVKAGAASIDCTMAIQKAIDAMYAQDGGVVYFPRGRYKCGALVGHGNVRLVGEVGAYQADNTSGVQLVLFGNNVVGIKATTVVNMGIENIRIDGSALTGTFNAGILLEGFWLSNFKNVTIVGITPAKGYSIIGRTGPDVGGASFGAQHNLFEMCECPDGIVRFEGKGPSDQVTTTVVNTLRGYKYETQHCQITYINATAEAWATGSGFYFYGSGDSAMLHCDIEGAGPVGITIGDTHVVRGTETTIWVGYSGAQRFNGQPQPPAIGYQATAGSGTYFPDQISCSDNRTTYSRLRVKADNVDGGTQEGHFELNRLIAGTDFLQFEWRKQWKLESVKDIANAITSVFSVQQPAVGGTRVKVTAWGVQPGAGAFCVARETVCVNNFGTLAKTDGVALAVQTGGAAAVITFTASGTNLLVQFNHGSASATAVSFVIEVDGESSAVLKI